MEGKNPDKPVLTNFIDAFSKEIKIGHSQVIAIYGTNIYTLYNELKSLQTEDNEFGDIVEVVRTHNSKNLKNYSRDNFSAVYLFFDLDIHGQIINEACEKIKKMISYFDNETENGKIYISYPMMESVYLCDNQEYLFKEDRCFVQLNKCLNDGFKKLTNSICHGNQTTIPVEGTENIKKICSACYMKANWLLLNEKKMPTDLNSFSQETIWNKQESYIKEFKKISILSSLPFFVGEYLGSNKMLSAMKAAPETGNEL